MNNRRAWAKAELSGAAADQTVETAWRRLEHAADDPSDPLRIFTLCTVTPEGAAAGRLMLLRGAEPSSNRLWCHTTRHGGKVADLRANPSFAVVAYDPVDCIQIRITGSAKIHELDSTTVRHFEQTLLAKRSGQIPAAALHDPLWPPAVEILIDRAKRNSWKEFVVIELRVETIDWTQVSDNRVTHAFVPVASSHLPTASPRYRG
ncbi:hypothetical protein BH09PLA1_BH09PLA1_00560 [soil metagenome]